MHADYNQGNHYSHILLTQLDKLQNKLVRQCVSLRKYCHISPLLRATGIIPVSDSIVYQCLDLCKNCILNDYRQ